ncbi:alpha/beta hydrolase (plasmid) [Streptomyces sp. BI20]|uniref:alpha/beta hydrolase n=1 Tax=Streptomyces sp. BI20 TaxID=3403460 RepID=UPI003C76AE43
MLVVGAVLAAGGAAYPVMDHFGVFSDDGDPVAFSGGSAKDAGDAKARAAHPDGKGLMPTGPSAEFKVAATVPQNGSKISVTTLHGAKSGFTGKVWVWTPPQYDEKANERKGFPVMVALPGGPGFQDNYWGSWPTFHNLEAKIDEWSKAGKSLPFILVMPVLNPQKDTGGLYWDGSDIPGQPKMGTWLTQDVPDFARANFRTINGRDGWAFMGSSSGGFAGLKAVLKDPSRFKAVLAGGPDVAPDSPLWKGHDQEKAANDPGRLAEKLIAANGPEVDLALQVGTKEPKSTMDAVKGFAEKYGRGPVKVKFAVDQGGAHNAKDYVDNMDRTGLIQWLSEHLQGPTPVA